MVPYCRTPCPRVNSRPTKKITLWQPFTEEGFRTADAIAATISAALPV
jgi:hypothetical protein